MVPQTKPVYRDLSQAELDSAYNSDRAVPDCHNIMKNLRHRSQKFRRQHSQYLDLRYGERERNLIDFFSSGIPDAPTLVFFHGGNWCHGSKEDFSVLGEGCLASGIDVAMIGYTLAPEANMGDIVSESKKAISTLSAHLIKLGIEPKLILCGWSAGAQLAMTQIDAPHIIGSLAVSGLFDLEPIKLCYLNKDIGLTTDDISRFSVFHTIPRKAPPLAIASGNAETVELCRQSRDYAAKWFTAGLPGKYFELQEHNHFSLLSEFGPAGALTKIVVNLAERSL
jgi:pimeloyl-ACP methyl ester carboxylesterase